LTTAPHSVYDSSVRQWRKRLGSRTGLTVVARLPRLKSPNPASNRSNAKMSQPLPDVLENRMQRRSFIGGLIDEEAREYNRSLGWKC
jgi:hypothetical protein